MLVVLTLLMPARVVLAADNVSIETSANGHAVEVHAAATINAPYALIWQTLTDYSRLSDFIPGMKVSRIIERRGDTAVVEQEGAARFLAFSHPIKVVVESIEQPPSVIGIRVVRGNLQRLDGQYEIKALAPTAGAASSYVLRWEGVIEPKLPVPGFISARLMRASVTDQFLGMVREIERRHALQQQRGGA